METISVTISTKDTEVLRKTADYLRDLAGGSQEATIIIRDETAGPIEVELNPEAEALATDKRIDDMVAAAGASELDKDNRPWDGRIDSSAKTKTADGRWKIARNKDKALVDQVKAELTATPPVTVETPTPPVTVETPTPPVTVETPTPPVTVETPTPPAAGGAYPQLILRLTEQARAKILQQYDVMDALNSTGAFVAGAVDLTALAKPEHAHFVPLVSAELERVWATRV
jgi:hypothetical protein